jgi:hypothetical protein
MQIILNNETYNLPKKEGETFIKKGNQLINEYIIFLNTRPLANERGLDLCQLACWLNFNYPELEAVSDTIQKILSNNIATKQN